MSAFLVTYATQLLLLGLLLMLSTCTTTPLSSPTSLPDISLPVLTNADTKLVQNASDSDAQPEGPIYAALESVMSSSSGISNINQPQQRPDAGKSTTKLFMKADPRKRKTERKTQSIDVPETEPQGQTPKWKCPNITSSRNLECGCDMPHTLRCSGDIHSLGKIADALRQSPYDVSLLDCTLKNVTFLSDERIFENISLHGLVISSGEIKRVHRVAFQGLKTPLQALGLPNNALLSVPWSSLTPFGRLERLDLSNNRIKVLGASDFVSLPNLTFLELSDNQISSISQRAFAPLKKLAILKLNGNRMADFTSSLHAIGLAVNLRELNLKSNSLAGPLTRHTLPALPVLESLNLDRNSFTSIQNGALQSFPYLVTLSLRHNQIDVLQDHAFAGLSSLQSLDLGYNGIVAVSGASLQHLGRLLVLDLTHNFLRALTADLTAPLPALRELRLNGNDISIVARNALDGASELHSLSLLDNPLSCDCTLRPFAEWLSVSKIPSQDLLGAICATPPHLEGAPLLQVPVESLSCEGGGGGGAGMSSANEFDNANVLQQLDAITQRESNGSSSGVAAGVAGAASAVRDMGDVIQLKRLHLSVDYGMILTWSVNMRNEEFTCDAVFVYRDSNDNEILLDSSPIHCESYMMDDENIVSVILRDTSGLMLGDSYRFCLVLLHERNNKRDLVVGCSNVTKLQAIETADISDYSNDGPTMEAAAHRLQLQKLYGTEPEIATDYGPNHSGGGDDGAVLRTVQLNASQQRLAAGQTIMVNNHISGSSAGAIGGGGSGNGGQRMELFGSLNRSFLPGLALGILITGLMALVFGIVRLKRQPLPCGQVGSTVGGSGSSTCYAAASSLHIPGAADPCGGSGGGGENHNRYLKLQATTSL